MTVTLVLELLFPVNINILLGWNAKTRIKEGKIAYVKVQKASGFNLASTHNNIRTALINSCTVLYCCVSV